MRPLAEPVSIQNFLGWIDLLLKFGACAVAKLNLNHFFSSREIFVSDFSTVIYTLETVAVVCLTESRVDSAILAGLPGCFGQICFRKRSEEPGKDEI